MTRYRSSFSHFGVVGAAIAFLGCTATPPEQASEAKMTVSKVVVPFLSDEQPFCVSLTEDETLIVYQSPRSHGHGNLDLWFSRFENGKWSEPYNAGPNINSSSHEADGKLSHDGTTLVFVRSDNLAKSTELYVSRFENGAWTKAEPLGPPVSPPETREFGASLSHDGKRLYFSSDRPGGNGGMDHYYSERIGQSWGEPVNLGPGINTKEDELDMTLSRDGKVIIFPTNRFDSIEGSTDLYVSRLTEGAWSPIQNLGSKINSPGADTCPWLGYDGTSLYLNSDWDFASGRKGDSSLVWKVFNSKGF